jgi:hypothetical protein
VRQQVFGTNQLMVDHGQARLRATGGNVALNEIRIDAIQPDLPVVS